MYFSAIQNPEERLDRLRLWRTPSVGPVTYQQLAQLYPSAGAAIEALPALARRGGAKAAPAVPSRAQAERELAAVAGAGAVLVALDDPDYPPLLKATEAPPPFLCLKGAPALARRTAVVGMVGARNASAAGLRLAREIAAGLGQAGVAVASGLARGIDGAVHGASLGTGTIGVLAGGIDVVYPPEHAELQARVGEAGLLIAEMQVGTVPQARHFPRRNRLISGISHGVVVVEAALRSGSLITARFALEQGREVMAVPGSPLDPRARGANDLIRQGARLVESAADVVEAIRPMLDRVRLPEEKAYRPEPAAAPDEAAVAAARPGVLELLSPVPTSIDELLRECDLTAPVLFTILLELELAGRLVRHAGGRVSLA